MYSTETGIYNTFIIGLTMLSLLLVIFLASYRRQQRQRMREYRTQVMRDFNLIEQERKRIAADLHDDFGSMLSAARLGLENLLDENPSNLVAQKTLGQLDHSIDRIKEIAHNLLPGILQAKGLGAAIEELAEEIRLSGKTRVVVDYRVNETDFVPEKTIFIFRILQEIVTNSLKHAHSDLIRIECSQNKQQLHVAVSDNGMGFIPEMIRKTGKQFGLQNISARLELLEGKYQFQTSQGQGTSYQIQIPLSSLTLCHEKKATHHYNTRR